jgi:ATP-dependent DNA helicase PIF1
MLRKFLSQAGDSAIVLAPTGVAAMNAGGQTIHSFFKFPPRLIEPADIRRLRSTRLIKAIDTMIIDEISMVRSDMLDAIDKSLKLNRASKRPFRRGTDDPVRRPPPAAAGRLRTRRRRS